MHYKNSRKDVARIGRELAVDYVVEGSVRRTAGRVYLNVQLFQVRGQTHVFARSYDVELKDVFTMQRRIAQAIAAQIPVFSRKPPGGVSGSETPGRNATADLAAYNEYIQARYFMGKMTPDAMARARRHLEEAVARDPEFASAYDALAEIHWFEGYAGLVSPREAFSRGIVYALRAIEIDNTRGETHALLGQFHKTIEYTWREVEREMTLAVQLDPTSPLVTVRYALSGLMPHGHLDEAIAELERALEFDPLSELARFWLGIMLLLSRRYERAIEEAERLLELDPRHWGACFVMHGCSRYKGKLAEAIESQRRAVELSGDSGGMLEWLGLSLAHAGQTAEARDVLGRLHGMAATGYVPPCSFAFVHLGLGEVDAAFSWLDRADDDCDQLMMPIKRLRVLRSLRGDPRFLALLRRMHLES